MTNTSEPKPYPLFTRARGVVGILCGGNIHMVEYTRTAMSDGTDQITERVESVRPLHGR